MLQSLIGRLRLAYRQVYHRLYINPKLEGDLITQFHKLYYDSHVFGKTWSNTYWLGHLVMKCPLDLWLYQEMIHTLQPDLIIETGTYDGGSALYFASLCDLVGKGRVLTIDVAEREGRPQHDRITYLKASSVAPATMATVREAAKHAKVILVVLDSDHRKAHVLEELRLYGPLVTKGSFLIVEDTNLNGHPVWPEHGPGPMEAVEEFMKGNVDFQLDKEKEKFLLSFNPKGYLKRV
jgi:cephalosporin hydroxylase